MIKWKKPNGTIIETNETEASIKAAVDMKWVQVKKRVSIKKEE